MTNDEREPGIAAVRRLDSFRFALAHLAPVFLQGLFTRNRFWVTFFSAFHPDPSAVKFVTRIQKKYKSKYLYLSLGKTRTLLVLDVEGIKHVLDNSPISFADPPTKRNGMSRFQPRALTISRGAEWQDRRRFNESVLDSQKPVHRHAERFLEIVHRECESVLGNADGPLTWTIFKSMFERISVQVIFGRAAADDRYLMRSLNKLMRNANLASILPPRSRLYEEFRQAIRGYMQWPESGCLTHDIAAFPSGRLTAVESQVPHWMFAMNETLATNTFRALALIAAHHPAQETIRDQLRETGLEHPTDLASQTYLTGCLQEAMRLWPTTPLIMRETTHDVALAGETVPARTQVMIFNSFNHRHPQAVEDADRFDPDRWSDGSVNYRFNHLSNGAQVCAGKNLALWLGTAVLAALLRKERYRLIKPRLNPDRAIPHSMNYFRARIARQAVE